ncbi:MAG TPA: helix-turn-helix domain-containing protein [Candidatus Saccharimonadales bacterium]|nr:helix-turn-helix domain-containing protein [Candidatus Saccharimonadales bacterium]
MPDGLTLEENTPDSPLVFMSWRATAHKPGVHKALAMQYWTFLFALVDGKKFVTLHRPHTKAVFLDYKKGVYWGVLLQAHVFMPKLIKNNVPAKGVELPVEGDYFFLGGHKLCIPDYEHTDSFAEELQRKGIVTVDALVAKALNGQAYMSPRTIQRRMLYVAGITQRELHMIRKARHAYSLLQDGVPIADAAAQAGYVDQAHLTKSLKLLAGQTPAQILAADTAQEN